jgi:hypothetical protein
MRQESSTIPLSILPAVVFVLSGKPGSRCYFDHIKLSLYDYEEDWTSEISNLSAAFENDAASCQGLNISAIGFVYSVCLGDVTRFWPAVYHHNDQDWTARHTRMALASLEINMSIATNPEFSLKKCEKVCLMLENKDNNRPGDMYELEDMLGHLPSQVAINWVRPNILEDGMHGISTKLGFFSMVRILRCDWCM